MLSFEELLKSSFGDNFDKHADEAINTTFMLNKDSWINNVVEGYVKYNTPPNATIVKIAGANNLNGEQVKRLVEESNVLIYLDEYSKTKNSRIHKVAFPIANTTEVLAELGKVEADSAVEGKGIESPSDSTTIHKAASAEAEHNFLTSTGSYEPSLWDAGKPETNFKELLVKEAALKIGEINKKAERYVKEVLQKIAFIGDALIYHERSGRDAGLLFDKIASDAGLDCRTQNIIASYVYKQAETLKKERKLPKNCSPTLVSKEATVQTSPLGKHSLAKSAGDNIIRVEGIPAGSDYEKLLQVAAEIKRDAERLRQEGVEMPKNIIG